MTKGTFKGPGRATKMQKIERPVYPSEVGVITKHGTGADGLPRVDITLDINANERWGRRPMRTCRLRPLKRTIPRSCSYRGIKGNTGAQFRAHMQKRIEKMATVASAELVDAERAGCKFFSSDFRVGVDASNDKMLGNFDFWILKAY